LILEILNLQVLNLQILDLQVNAVIAGDFAKALFSVVKEFGRRDGLGVETSFAGFDAGQREQVFREAGHAGGILADDFQKLAGGRDVVRSGVEQGFGIALDRSERGAQFVGNVGDEIAAGFFDALGFGKIAKHGDSATIGQRRGVPGGFSHPMYVIAIRPEQLAVVIGTRDELLGGGIIASEVNWLADAPSVGDAVSVRVRHRSPLARAEIVRLHGHEIELALDEPVSAITPGQSVVFYDGGRVLGGGLIDAARARRAPLPVLAA